MDDPFFASNAVTYTGFTTDQNPVAAVLTNINGGASCMVVINTSIPGLGAITGTLTGTISQDGTTCDFAGTQFHVTLPIVIDIAVISGTATLSDNGMVLTTSDIVVTNPQTQQPLNIPGVVLTCESVAELAESQQADPNALQIIHDEALQNLKNELEQ
jgi:hypothetical protein